MGTAPTIYVAGIRTIAGRSKGSGSTDVPGTAPIEPTASKAAQQDIQWGARPRSGRVALREPVQHNPLS